MRVKRLELFMAIAKSVMIRIIALFAIFFTWRSVVIQPPLPSRTQNMFNGGMNYTVHCYISEDELIDWSTASPLWIHPGLVYGALFTGPNKDGTHQLNTTIKMTPALRNNNSVYLHAFITEDNMSPDPNSDIYSGQYYSYARKNLNLFKDFIHNGEDVFSVKDPEAPENNVATPDVAKEGESYWYPNLKVYVVTDQTLWTPGLVPEGFHDYVQFNPDGKTYKTPFYFEVYGKNSKEYVVVDNTVDELELTLTIEPQIIYQWFETLFMRHYPESGSWNVKNEEKRKQASATSYDTDIPIFNAYMAIGAFFTHNILEIVAFNNDYKFWKNQQSQNNLSIRSVSYDVLRSFVVLLYMLNTAIHQLVCIGCTMWLLHDVLKFKKILALKFDKENRLFGLLPKITLVDKSTSETVEYQYDKEAYHNVSQACFFLWISIGTYTFLQNDYGDLYTFVLNMTYGYFLTSGFTKMIREVFINHKMKSVEYIPWVMMPYKIFGTFTDDMFSYFYEMPILYALGSLRDDIVLVIVLYQRWIYNVDSARINEFGFSKDMEINKTEEEDDQSDTESSETHDKTE